MDKNRNYILDRITSRKTSIEEFDFDQLQAPPLAMFFSPFDIQELHAIATSIKYSAKPEVRYAEIDKVMKRRGLLKFGAGTNRVVYRHPEFPNIVFKVAADAIGLGDNPAEYRNQFLLKPFVTKCFEISPCGTIGIFEKVNPITSREEFISVIDDVFELITEWLVGEFILADIGCKFFANYGIRKGFGVVLLDYPYVYKLDGNKLYCQKPDTTSPSGKCEGIIDYDFGYNMVHCTKCGAIYKAKELENKIKDNEIIAQRKGDIKMKVNISGGTKAMSKMVNTGAEFSNSNFKEPSLKVSVSEAANMGVNGVVPKKNKTATINVDGSSNTVLKAVPNRTKTVEAAPVVEEAKLVVEEVVEAAPVVAEQKYVNGVSPEHKVAKSPIKMSEDIKAKAVADKKEDNSSPVKDIEVALQTIAKNLEKVDIDTVKEDLIERMIDSCLSSAFNNIDVVKFMSILARSFSTYVNTVVSECSDEVIDEVSNIPAIVDVVKSLYTPTIKVKQLVNDEDDNIYMEYTSDIVTVNTTIENVWDDLYSKVASIEALKDLLDLTTEENATAEETEEVEATEEAVEETEEADSYNGYEGMKMFDAVTINVKDVFPTQQAQNVIVIIDEYGNYLCNNIEGNNCIIAIDKLDDMTVNNTKVVSSSWLENTIRRIDAETEDEEAEEEEVIEASTSTVGVMPPVEEPAQSGISVEEFLQQEG